MYAPDTPASRPPKEIWEIARSQLRLQMTKSTYDTWVRDTVCLAYEDGAFVIGVANGYAKDWLSMRLRSVIKRTLTSIVGQAVDVSFVVRAATADGDNGSAGPLLEPDAVTDVVLPETLVMPETIGPPGGATLNPRYTFETYIVGSSNRMAHAVALAVAERPGNAYNPLFLYGGSGLGKTHLLQAIGHMAQHQRMRVLYVTSELFTNELIAAIRTQTTDHFRAKYRNTDLLLLDDVHFIAGKEQTQEEFFHTFNALYDAQKQIVISSDCPPREIPTLEERLHSRFEWGLIADIQPPDLETKVAILKRKAEIEKIDLPDNVALFIASKIKSNIRELEGSLVRLVAYASLKGLPIGLDLAQEVLKNIIEEESDGISIEFIQKTVASHYGLKVSDLKSKNNSRSIAVPRQVAMYLCKTLTRASLPEIGREFGGKHHTTVLHSINKITQLYETDSVFHRLINSLIAEIK
jgi:chromosomal replication initiator protein